MRVITSDVMTSELMQVGIRPSGYRLPDEARVGRVRLQVSDLRRVAAVLRGRRLGFVSCRKNARSPCLGARAAPLSI